ncbi:hypothetical protein CR162_21175 [Pseudoroseomonas rhizosphaerae]|uniref:Uncharacterized protein n=1 Tax=Teichococcus rhizosphaerae TaxID=1335062 RepID=A0A2C7A7C6_9PROT|nr:hypothetical protein [Pseudoroseomonas rhizosphaerae]PHK92946.1 hypothetical protein CR162_21175 [Pseudoroseomonas rhizosphaerae]
MSPTPTSTNDTNEIVAHHRDRAAALVAAAKGDAQRVSMYLYGHPGTEPDQPLLDAQNEARELGHLLRLAWEHADEAAGEPKEDVLSRWGYTGSGSLQRQVRHPHGWGTLRLEVKPAPHGEGIWRWELRHECNFVGEITRYKGTTEYPEAWRCALDAECLAASWSDVLMLMQSEEDDEDW